MSERLQKLAVADPGFFVLALHSRMETLMRGELDFATEMELSFSDLVDEFCDRLAQKGKKTTASLFHRISAEHRLTNRVRHAYAFVDSQEAAAAARNFCAFLQEIGADDDPEFHDLPQFFRDWNEKPWTFVPSALFRNLEQENRNLKAKNEGLLGQYPHLKALEDQQERLNADVERQKLTIADLEKKFKQKDARFDEKRQEAAEAREELRRMQQEMTANRQALKGLADLRRYLDNVKRMALYSQTRGDYERHLMRLTPEQETLVERLPLDRDTLIRGSAGTGKSLVLIKLLGRIVAPSNALNFGSAAPKVVLLTFTRSLTKYNLYLSQLLKVPVPPDAVQTVDAFLWQLVAPYLKGGWNYEWQKVPAYQSLLDGCRVGLSAAELKKELDDLIWGWGISHDEYLDFERTGFKKALAKKDRETVWSLAESLASLMDDRKDYSPSLVLSRLRTTVSENERAKVDYLLLDEAQDLSPVKLRTLHSVVRKGFIAAGDTDQSLYQSFSPFARADIDIRGGRTKVLKTNFRNTEPIHRLAETFRLKKRSADRANEPQAYRDGPPPEIHVTADGESLRMRFVQKLRVYLEEFEYAPETILVLHQGEKPVLETLLEVEGIAYKNLADADFDFAASTGLRLTKFPSAKGLDYPVVLVYWHRVFALSGLDKGAEEDYLRNLLYVAMTRAMEHLDVFATEDDPFTGELEALGRGERDGE